MCAVYDIFFFCASREVFRARAAAKGWSTERADRAWNWLMGRAMLSAREAL